jgi:hypothetical protein
LNEVQDAGCAGHDHKVVRVVGLDGVQEY